MARTARATTMQQRHRTSVARQCDWSKLVRRGGPRCQVREALVEKHKRAPLHATLNLYRNRPVAPSTKPSSNWLTSYNNNLHGRRAFNHWASRLGTKYMSAGADGLPGQAFAAQSGRCFAARRGRPGLGPELGLRPVAVPQGTGAQQQNHPTCGSKGLPTHNPDPPMGGVSEAPLRRS